MEIEHTNNEQVYFLDLPTLSTILSRQKRSGTLRAEPVRVPNVRGTVSIVIIIEHGVVRSCQVRQKQRVLFEEEQAYQMALALQSLEWRWRPLPLAVPPVPSAQEFSPGSSVAPLASGAHIIYPQYTVRVQDRSILRQLSRQHNRVLALCDGTHSLYQVASMLGISFQDLTPYVRDLEQWGIIQLFSSQPSDD